MEWLLGSALAAAVIVVHLRSKWRSARNWRRVNTALSAAATGRGAEPLPENASLEQTLEQIAEIVAESRRLREQTTREEFHLRAILSSMEEGVMVVDAQHVLRQVNPSFMKLFELKGDPCGQTVLHTLRTPEFEQLITRALATDEPQAEEVARNGGRPLRHFAVHVVPVHDNQDHQGVVAIFRDITRLKQLEEVRKEFVSNVSHELRTPLSIFHGYLEVLLDQPAMPRKDQTSVFEILRKHSLRLNALLNDLLILARLESRHETLQLQPVCLQSIARDLIEDWKLRAARKKIVFEVEIEAGLPELLADRRRMDQVLNNLLENAIKYTEEGGRVGIRARSIGTALELRVEDTGLGIPPADLPHIFERFYRADKARTRELGGTGLGLSIVKHIVQLHGGSVVAESTYGKGTAIILRLPWQPPAST